MQPKDMKEPKIDSLAISMRRAALPLPYSNGSLNGASLKCATDGDTVRNFGIRCMARSPARPQGGGDRLKVKVYELRRRNFRARRHRLVCMDFHVVEGAPGARVARRRRQQARIGIAPMACF
ncbi:hypothetical protein C8J57DRAFT_1237832 [Mycena rebaudengoi]|nr:hypothetical protein C8J57DRAFT_1237832 [Mycena rebaudengoi]